MNLSLLMTINTVVAAIFGIAFVIAPGQAVSLYGVTADAPLRYTAQLFGSALLGFAVLTWMARKATASDARNAIVLALFVADGLGFVLALIGQLGGVVNSMGWSTVVIYLLLALGFGYFQFLKPAAT
jgi:hypothetical protein